MAASKRTMVTAVFRNRADAENAFEWLRARGYGADEVNVLMSDATRATYYPQSNREEPLRKAETAALEGMGVGGAIGTVVGASLAAILAIGTTLAIPGLGLVIAGPIAAALAGGGAGAVTGGILGALVGVGIPEPNARAYEEALREGGVVIGVFPRNNEESSRIKQHFEDRKGESVCTC